MLLGSGLSNAASTRPYPATSPAALVRNQATFSIQKPSPFTDAKLGQQAPQPAQQPQENLPISRAIRAIPRDSRRLPLSPDARKPRRREATQQAQSSTGYLVAAPGRRPRLQLEITRDCRNTGLREHKLRRSQAQQQLADDPENAVAGKTRRYGITRESYLL